ncbi:hypothetical protein Taro_009946 [Colocasia esculenta]|uniref:Uncharacterized protein n=1 Tax=Colocasia esculenta TaxID=4460 RepID=A0A843U844_COLES|nr:hypothetical protein [Colocasia esculenta]
MTKGKVSASALLTPSLEAPSQNPNVFNHVHLYPLFVAPSLHSPCWIDDGILVLSRLLLMSQAQRGLCKELPDGNEQWMTRVGVDMRG